ncbi:hypothetical protein BGX38DRAFT_1187374 [Terfezia claveryi]|nr:hypothetical protein BGX38DRAFT_1187374 [Terfezia claveryi]
MYKILWWVARVCWFWFLGWFQDWRYGNWVIHIPFSIFIFYFLSFISCKSLFSWLC